jgi:hypothetical protein
MGAPQPTYSRVASGGNSDSRMGPQHADRHWKALEEVKNMPAKKAKPKAPAKKASKSTKAAPRGAKKRSSRH